RDFFDGKLTPLVGLRYYRDQQSIDSSTNFPPTTFNPNETFSATSPRFNLRYRPNESTEIYANVAKGFRSGVFNSPAQILNGIGIGATLPEALKESTLWSYELGGRFTLFDNRLRLEPTAYYEVYQDYQFEGSSGNINFDLPIEEVEGKGAEMLIT